MSDLVRENTDAVSDLVQEGDGTQVALWRVFYEQAWKLRAEFMEGLIADGERDPFRIIALLEQQERFYQVLMNVNEEKSTWRELGQNGEMLPTGTPVLRSSSFRGVQLNVPYYVSHDLPLIVVDYAKKRGPFDCIIELGCGYGQNLFRIFSKGGPKVPYYGGEYTDSGVGMARKLAGLVPELGYEFFHFNHLQPDLSRLPRFRRALVFTCHSIEQVLDVPQQWFDTVAAIADEVHCIHMEPFGFQVQNLGPMSQRSLEFFQDKGWNRNLAAAAVEAASRGAIKLENMVLDLGYTDSPSNLTSLLFWKNDGAAAG